MFGELCPDGFVERGLEKSVIRWFGIAFIAVPSNMSVV